MIAKEKGYSLWKLFAKMDDKFNYGLLWWLKAFFVQCWAPSVDFVWVQHPNKAACGENCIHIKYFIPFDCIHATMAHCGLWLLKMFQIPAIDIVHMDQTAAWNWGFSCNFSSIGSTTVYGEGFLSLTNPQLSHKKTFIAYMLVAFTSTFLDYRMVYKVLEQNPPSRSSLSTLVQYLKVS